MEKTIQIIGVECDDGRFFISDKLCNGYHSSSIEGLFFDRKELEKSLCEHWFIVYKRPSKVTRKVSQPDINCRYELIDKSMQTDKIPLVLKQEDVAVYVDYEWLWKDDYSHLKSLYTLVSDKQPDKFEDVRFEFTVLLKVKDIPKAINFSYDVNKTRWNHDGLIQLTEKDVDYQLIDRLIFPKPVLPQRPCAFSSSQTYGIVRQYVKQHINLNVAKITSDYDFCFTVKKIIPLAETEKFTVNVNLFSKRKSKYETRYRKTRFVECFEMTHEKEGYQNYTPIKGFQGKDHKDLKEKIDIYCKSLIEYINKPVEDCKHCNGLGVKKLDSIPERKEK